MAIEPNNGDIRHALGLLLVRQHEYTAALPLLQRASELAPDNPRYAYVYAVALNSSGSLSRQSRCFSTLTKRTRPTGICSPGSR